MPLTFTKPLDVQRPYKSYRIDGYSLKAGRRMTLYGKAAMCQLIELEANPAVTAVCERPLIIPDSKPKRVVDFWALEGGVPTFYLLLKNGELGGSSKLKRAYTEFCDWVTAERAKVKEVSIEVFEARRVRHENWLTILEHLVSHKGQVTPALIERCSNELPGECTVTQAESMLTDIDPMLARAALFHLLARGTFRCPTIDEQPLHPKTLMVRT
jgi:hypothetical protein